jgi:hypothetical protein
VLLADAQGGQIPAPDQPADRVLARPQAVGHVVNIELRGAAASTVVHLVACLRLLPRARSTANAA